MHLVGVLVGFRVEGKIQRDLISLVHHIGSRARGHATTVKQAGERNGAEIFLDPGRELVGRGGIIGVGPENDDMGKHVGG